MLSLGENKNGVWPHAHLFIQVKERTSGGGGRKNMWPQREEKDLMVVRQMAYKKRRLT